MDNVSTWISLAALVVSVGALMHTLFRSASQTRLDAVQARADLLTRIVELKLEYEQEVNHLLWLAEVAHRARLPDANELTKKVISYKKYVAMAQEHYDWLIGMDSASKAALLEIGHHIDALRVRVKTETASLENVRERIHKMLSEDHE